MNTTDIDMIISLEKKNLPLSYKVTIAWCLGIVALSFSALSGDLLEEYFGLSGQLRYGLQALVMSGIVCSCIWYVRWRFDKNSITDIGIGNLWESISKFALGIGLILVPLVITIALTVIFGWGTVNFNISTASIGPIVIGFVTVFLSDALPEEILFRGYIYSHLNTKFVRWKSALFTIGLFVLLPVVALPIQKYVFGLDVSFGGASSISGGYLITMVFFGAFMQYLRILTNSIWVGIGFHLLFVYMNQLIGIDPNNIIQLTEFSNETNMQITLICLLVITFGVLLLYPRLNKRRLGWNKLYKTVGQSNQI